MIAFVRHQVTRGTLTIDAARDEILAMIASGEISEQAGRLALDQLG